MIGFLFGFFVILAACQKGEQVTTDANAKLNFDRDTILFDTVFTTISTVTKRVKLFNRNNDALRISDISLAGGNTSPFSININGEGTPSKSNLIVNGKDSVNLFVKATINPNNKDLPFLVQDSIILNTNGNRQVIQLIAYGQNANFINTDIVANTTWNSALPYVLSGSIWVKAGVQLNIVAGNKVYFNKDAGLNIAGELNVTGTATAPVLFCSDRLESTYADEPGQWKGIYLTQAGNGLINHAVIKNASVGITSDSLSGTSKPKLLLANTIVKNMQVAGYIGYHSEMLAFNNLFYNCGNYLIYAIGGGNYNLKQNTLVGFNPMFPRKTAALTFSDYLSNINYNKLSLTLTNNIIWGSLSNELDIQKKSTVTPQLAISYNLIKSNVSTYNVNNNILNAEPGFLDASFGIFELSSGSPALIRGTNLSADPYFNNYLSTDLNANSRNFPSTLGCYEKR
ncbi:hypothetical protein [Pedobacter sandarakinus]|uniref:hypothetical protein n=1 Tax=Pedobacter sandarakinus TaxID=353156 RepID=UPI002246BB5B|nr:hypothetical protein [Pedobacter sandarakinus]MCX2574036.1 hypothetical protein [Pedobacter sandarakinus]